MSEDVAIAQIVTAITTVFYAAVFAIGYYLDDKGQPRGVKGDARGAALRQAAASHHRGELAQSANSRARRAKRQRGGRLGQTLELSGSLEDSSDFSCSPICVI